MAEAKLLLETWNQASVTEGAKLEAVKAEGKQAGKHK